MTKNNLHPSVQQFKAFIKKHPNLIQEVRKGNKNWQELYEDWYLLGEEDEIWKPYKAAEEKEVNTKKENKSDLMSQILRSVKKIDVNEMQQHIENVNNAISTIQNLLSQFQGVQPKNHQAGRPDHPFSFRQD
jgi:ABC-type antimicrobial peptide transport system permease subunit